MTSATKRVAEAVREAMTAKGITQMALSDALGISQSAVSRRITGAQPFDVAELATVADALGLDFETLLSSAGHAA